MMWGPFGPVVDGEGGLLPKTPKELRDEGNFMKVKMIAGLTEDQGAYLAGEVGKIKVAEKLCLLNIDSGFYVICNT